MNKIACPLRFVRLSLLFVGIVGLLLAIPAVDAYVTNPSKTTQNEDGRRTYSAASPASVRPLQQTKLNTNLPSKRYSINVNPEEITFTLGELKTLGKTQSHQIGVGRNVSMMSAKLGNFFVNQDSSKIRLLAIKSPGAVGMRIHLEQFDVAPGDKVYVYGTAADSYVAGPYTGQGPFGPEKGTSGGAFWTDTIEGDTVIIEHYIAGEEKDFYISEISHLYKSIPGNDAAPNVLACHNDAMCFSDPEKNSVGRIVFVNGGSSFVCTGTIMNNQTSDFAPYFYTASHCVSTQTVAQTVETYWFYRTTSCNSGVVSGSWVRTTAGTSLLATLQTADSTLLRILNSVPGLWFAGSDPNVKAIGTAVFGLSHPGGGLPPSTESYLRRASGSISATNAVCSDTGLINGYTADWTSGLIEPGSSGSSLFTTSGATNFVVGVLSCGFFPSSCADLALYGKYSDFFPTVQSYINLGDNTGACAPTPITVGQTINGSLAAGDCISRVRGVGFNSDRYSFSGTAGDQIAIFLSSPSVDTYLYLLSPSKTLAAQDDDGGGGTNSRIPNTSGFFSLPSTGTYIIEATSFSTGETGSYSLTLNGVSPCSGVASPPTATVSSSAGNGNFTVTTTPSTGCSWTASSNAAWLTTTSTGSGTSTANYAFSANPGPGSRTGIITVAGSGWSATHTVTQNPPTPCNGTASPTSATVGAGSSSNTFTVTTTPSTGCNWTASSNAAWLTTTSTGTGSGTVLYNFSANSGPQRVGIITVTGSGWSATHTVTQTAGGCTNTVQVSIPTTLTGASGSTILVPINVTSLTGLGVTAYDFVLTFNSSIVSPASPAFDTAGTLSSGFTITPNTGVIGQITVSAFGTTALSGSGTLLNLRFTLAGSPGSCSNLTWSNFKFNEGNPCSTLSNGQACVGVNGSIAGTVSYCITPAVKVPGVTLMAAGTPSGSATTAADGTYTIPNLGNVNYTVTLTKTGAVNGISSFDASQVAQHAAGLITLSACQQLAGDASNNGSLSSFDASLIAQTVAGIPNSGIAGTWKFVPSTRSYTPLNGAVTGQNYDAVLVGDVSGNWAAAGPINQGPEQPPILVSLSKPFAASSDSVTVSIIVGELTERGVKSYDFTLAYDPEVLQLLNPAITVDHTLSHAMTITANTKTLGRLVVSAFGTSLLAGSGTLLNIPFKVIGGGSIKSAAKLKTFIFNENVPRAKLVVKKKG